MRIKIENLGYIKNVDLDLISRITLIQGEDTFRGNLVPRTLMYMTDEDGFWTYNFDGLFTEINLDRKLEISSGIRKREYRSMDYIERGEINMDIVELDHVPYEISSGHSSDLSEKYLMETLFYPVNSYLEVKKKKKERLTIIINEIDQFDRYFQKLIVDQAISRLCNNKVDLIISSNSSYVELAVREYASKMVGLDKGVRKDFLSIYNIKDGISNPVEYRLL
jgi:hypothetical protein